MLFSQCIPFSRSFLGLFTWTYTRSPFKAPCHILTGMRKTLRNTFPAMYFNTPDPSPVYLLHKTVENVFPHIFNKKLREGIHIHTYYKNMFSYVCIHSYFQHTLNLLKVSHLERLNSSSLADWTIWLSLKVGEGPLLGTECYLAISLLSTH